MEDRVRAALGGTSGDAALLLAIGGISGGCAGVFAGGIVGSLFPSWKTVYERR